MGRRDTLWQGVVGLAGLLVVAGCASTVPVSGLRPEYPEVRATVFTNELASVEVDSLQPTLRWEAFPRPQDREADREGHLSRIRSVTYDLRIWRATNAYPAELIYAREGFPEPSHRVEVPLERSTEYFWTVRARFELDGDVRVTGWGLALRVRLSDLQPAVELLKRTTEGGPPQQRWRTSLVPPPFPYYPFKTPPR